MTCILSANIMAASDTLNPTTHPVNTNKITNHEEPKDMQWQGFYIGANAGGWWSTNNSVNSTGISSYINGNFIGSTNIANALAIIGTNNFLISSQGFIGGGQVGYNHLFRDNLVIGLDLDMNGLTNQKQNISATKMVNLVNFAEHYNSSMFFTKNIDYIGTVRGRLGMLLKPTLLLYGTAGLAYGGISFGTAYNASESLAPPNYDPVIMQNNIKTTRAGWTAGGGLEWMFRPNWSAKIEGIYYDLGTINNNVTLSQISNLPLQPVVWGAANVNAATTFTSGAIRVGLNYHC